MSLQYQRKLSSLSREELESEREALNRLLRTLGQEYDDRRETINFVLAQRSKVDNLLSYFEHLGVEEKE